MGTVVLTVFSQAIKKKGSNNGNSLFIFQITNEKGKWFRSDGKRKLLFYPALSADCDHWKRADACRKLKTIRKQEGEVMKTLDFFKTMAWLASTTTIGSRGIPGEANYFFDHGADPFVGISISMNDLFMNKFMLAGGFDNKKGIPVMTDSQDRFHLHEMKFIKYEFIQNSQKLLRRRRSLKPHTKKSFAYRNHWFKN